MPARCLILDFEIEEARGSCWHQMPDAGCMSSGNTVQNSASSGKVPLLNSDVVNDRTQTLRDALAVFFEAIAIQAMYV